VDGPLSFVTLQPRGGASSTQRDSEVLPKALKKQPCPGNCSAAAASTRTRCKAWSEPECLDPSQEWCSSKGSVRSVKRPLDFGLGSSSPALWLSGLEGSKSSNTGACCGGACPGEVKSTHLRSVLDSWMQKMEDLSHHSVWPSELDSNVTGVLRRSTAAPVPPPAFTALSMMGYELP
jgi:hypothetical protein